MKTSNYLYIAHSQMYGMLHGMHTGGCVDNLTLEDAKDIARAEASAQRAKAVLDNKNAPNTDIRMAEARLKRALIRKNVASHKPL